MYKKVGHNVNLGLIFRLLKEPWKKSLWGIIPQVTFLHDASAISGAYKFNPLKWYIPKIPIVINIKIKIKIKRTNK
jgi:hypothetical protein